MTIPIQDKSSVRGRAQEGAAVLFAAQESERIEALSNTAALAPIGAGTTTYAVSISSSNGFALLSWNASNQPYGGNIVSSFDWIGVFTNAALARVNPNSNFLGGSAGFQWAANGSQYTTDVQLQQGMVAAYVIKNSDGNYVTVAISQPAGPQG